MTETYVMKTCVGTDVTITITDESAPTALLLGWFGATPRSLSKYASLYRSLGYNTLQTAAPPSVVFSLSHASIPPYLLSLLRILASDPRLLSNGLVLAAFSNGGACVLPSLAAALSPTAPSPKGHPGDAAAAAAARAALSALVLDSAPAFPSPVALGRMLARGLGLARRPWAAAVIERGMRAVCWLQDWMHGDVRGGAWRAVRGAAYPCPELYMYSAADDLVDAEALDELVSYRKRERLGEVRVWRVGDAPHVQLLRTHRAQYVETIRGVNEWGVNAWRRRQGFPNWLLPPLDD